MAHHSMSVLGMRRVNWVRIEVLAEGSVVCDVIGVGHRLPIALRVPLATATGLAASGVPTIVRCTKLSAAAERVAS